MTALFEALKAFRESDHSFDRAPTPEGQAVLDVWDATGDILRKHAIPALRDAATKPCRRSNCGTKCLCMRCHARKALEVLDPSWRP